MTTSPNPINDEILYCGDKEQTSIRIDDIVGFQVGTCAETPGQNNLRILTRGGMVVGTGYTYCIENGAVKLNALKEKLKEQRRNEVATEIAADQRRK